MSQQVAKLSALAFLWGEKCAPGRRDRVAHNNDKETWDWYFNGDLLARRDWHTVTLYCDPECSVVRMKRLNLILSMTTGDHEPFVMIKGFPTRKGFLIDTPFELSVNAHRGNL